MSWFTEEFPRIATGRGAEWRCTCGRVNPENARECRTCGINWMDAAHGHRSRKRPESPSRKRNEEDSA